MKRAGGTCMIQSPSSPRETRNPQGVLFVELKLKVYKYGKTGDSVFWGSRKVETDVNRPRVRGARRPAHPRTGSVCSRCLWQNLPHGV